MRHLFSLAIASLLVLGTACPTDPGDTDGGVDAGPDDGGGGDDGGTSIPPWPATAAEYDALLTTYVHELQKPSKVGIAYDCCRDFGAISKDKIEEDRDDLDNAVAGFFDALGLLTGYSLQDTIDTDLHSGTLMLLFDHWGYQAADQPFVLVRLDGDFEGSTTFASASAGGGTFLADPASFLAGTGEPVTKLEATITPSGELSAFGPSLHFPLGMYGGSLQLELRDLVLEATADETNTTIGYRRGKMSGYFTVDDFFASINTYLDATCGCLGNTAPIFAQDTNGNWSSECVTDALTTCPLPEETFCVTVGDADPLSACELLPRIFPDAADLDLDGDPTTFEALSLGLAWQAVPAEVVGLMP